MSATTSHGASSPKQPLTGNGRPREVMKSSTLVRRSIVGRHMSSTYDSVIMDRRTFISSVAGGLLAVSPASRAQKSTMPVIGFLHGESPEGYAHHGAAFRQGLT